MTVEQEDDHGRGEMDTADERVSALAAGMAADDVFVLRRIAGARYVHVGGAGRGTGWAGLLEVELSHEPWLAAAVASGEPSRRDVTRAESLLGPYYATSAVAVPLDRDAVVVFGARAGRIAAPDGTAGWQTVARAVADEVHAVSPAKHLADELEVMHALQALGSGVHITFSEALTHVARCAVDALSCELGLVWWRETGEVAAIADGWTLPGTAAGRRRVLERLAGRTLPTCVQDLGQAPIGEPFTPDQGCRSAYALPIGVDAGVLLVIHTDGGPRGFTDLCRELGRKLGVAAEGVLRAAGTRAQLQDEIDRAYHLARQDPLTGLANRRAWDEALAAEPQRLARTGRTSIVLADVVGLKAINDRCGHQCGDGVLRAAGVALSTAVRDLDLVARVGGDEFAVLLPGLGAHACRTVVRRIEALVAESPAIAPEPLGLALGWATADAGTDLTDSVAEADDMLRAAKIRGRGVELARQIASG